MQEPCQEPDPVDTAPTDKQTTDSQSNLTPAMPSFNDLAAWLVRDLQEGFPVGPPASVKDPAIEGLVTFSSRAKAFGISFYWDPHNKMWVAFNWRSANCPGCTRKVTAPGYHDCPAPPLLQHPAIKRTHEPAPDTNADRKGQSKSSHLFAPPVKQTTGIDDPYTPPSVEAIAQAMIQLTPMPLDEMKRRIEQLITAIKSRPYPSYQPTPEDVEPDPHTFIQWKGTNVCMDIYCPNPTCKAHGHVDADFVYTLKCRHCNTVYQVGQEVKLTALTEDQVRGSWLQAHFENPIVFDDHERPGSTNLIAHREQKFVHVLQTNLQALDDLLVPTDDDGLGSLIDLPRDNVEKARQKIQAWIKQAHD